MSTVPLSLGLPKNPLLEDIRQKARQALQPDTPPPALMPPPGMESGAPPIMQSQQPNVTDRHFNLANAAPQSTLLGQQQKRGQEIASGSGASQVYGDVTNSHFGQNHPLAGKLLGGLAQGAATAGDIIGTGVAGVLPRLSPLVQSIPGTTMHHNMLVGQQDRNINQMQGEQQKTAQIAEENARANALNEPNLSALPTDEGYQSFNQKTGETKPLTSAQGQPLTPYEKPEKYPLQHVALPDGSVVAITRDPKTGVVSADEVYKGDPKMNAQITPLEIGGVEHSVLVDKGTGSMIKDLGPTGNKPATVNVNAGLNELDRVSGRLAKPYQDSYKAGGENLQKINQTLHSVAAGYVGQGLAIPELLTSLVSGQGTGVRITQPELNAITAARGIKGDAESWFNTLAGKGKLTDTDKAQITAVLGDARKRLEDKIRINSQALDKINGAGKRQDAVDADKEARGMLNDFERSGHFVGQSITLKNGQIKTVTAVHSDGTFDAN